MKISASTGEGKFKFRGVQLDLARQAETVDYIKSFVDFSAAQGFNFLVLYLEGRIRTKSFSFSRRTEVYTPDDIRRIVEHASKKGMETVPVVSMFGHADIFLECPELEHLAELRGGREGRFSKHKHVFCPSLPETTSFLSLYVEEVAELFPSKYFHAGFDEAWDIGYCDMCRKRLETETQADLFGRHLSACHEIVAGRLGKQMMIWDDMFDLYPEVLEKLPRDIVMCAWQYDSLVEEPSGHCGGSRSDKLAHYERLGFPHVFAPVAFSIRNVESLSAYASKRNPKGGLLTSWELERSFLLSDYPTIAYAGKLWSGRENNLTQTELQEISIREVTGCGKKEQMALFRNILNFRDARLYSNRQAYIKGPLSEPEYDREAQVIAARAMLAQMPDNGNDDLAGTVREDMAICLDEELFYFELRRLFDELYSSAVVKPPHSTFRQRIENAVARLESIKCERLRQWMKHRPGIDCHNMEKHFEQVKVMLEGAWEDAGKVCGLLRVRFLFSLSNMVFSLRWKGDEAWQNVAAIRISHQPQQGMGQYLIPIYSSGVPEALRIEASGIVGAGITYLEFIGGKGERHVPESIAGISGNVTMPEALLEDGADWCRLGEWEQDARRKFLNPELAKIKHAVEIKLRKT